MALKRRVKLTMSDRLHQIAKVVKSEKVDAKKILEELNVERQGVTLRLNKELWKKFKQIIGVAEQNRVIEKLLIEFIKDFEKNKK